MAFMVAAKIVTARLRSWLTVRPDELSLHHSLYAVTVAASAGLIWLANWPPMADMPQHVAQVALLHDLLTRQSPWASEFRINLLTPYLIGYGLALPLSFIVSATTAVKIVLTGAFLAFVASLRQLARETGSDERLDWLFIPAFFGFAYAWGFYTFLVACPLGVQFIRYARRHSISRDIRSGLKVVGFGVALLFSHGLVFLFAGLVGGVLMLAGVKNRAELERGATPYLVLALACLSLFVANRLTDPGTNLSGFQWGADPLIRVGRIMRAIQSPYNKTFVPLTLALLAAPLFLGLRFDRSAAKPLVVLLIVLMVAPFTALSTDFVYERFAIFALPMFALSLKQSEQPPAGQQLASLAVIVVATWASLGLHVLEIRTAAVEASHFRRVLDAAEPGRRAARVTSDRYGTPPITSFYLPSWYEVEKHGLVEFNFAQFAPEIVRYRQTMPTTGFVFNPRHLLFSWNDPHARDFDYYFVREDGGHLPPEFLDGQPCGLRLVATSSPWSLFERGPCK
jgi:hypothetical protein